MSAQSGSGSSSAVHRTYASMNSSVNCGTGSGTGGMVGGTGSSTGSGSGSGAGGKGRGSAEPEAAQVQAVRRGSQAASKEARRRRRLMQQRRRRRRRALGETGSHEPPTRPHLLRRHVAAAPGLVVHWEGLGQARHGLVVSQLGLMPAGPAHAVLRWARGRAGGRQCGHAGTRKAAHGCCRGPAPGQGPDKRRQAQAGRRNPTQLCSSPRCRHARLDGSQLPQRLDQSLFLLHWPVAHNHQLLTSGAGPAEGQGGAWLSFPLPWD